jgi:uncharacterized protein (DUF4415 family)
MTTPFRVGTALRAFAHPTLAQPILRLDPDVLAHCRRTGRRWHGRINAVLRKAARLPKEKRKRA